MEYKGVLTQLFLAELVWSYGCTANSNLWPDGVIPILEVEHEVKKLSKLSKSSNLLEVPKCHEKMSVGQV